MTCPRPNKQCFEYHCGGNINEKCMAKSGGKIMRYLLDDGAFAPQKAHDTDAGYDLRSPANVTVVAHGSSIINTGVHIEIPSGYVGMLKSKSGLNVKHGITSEGVIDCGYTGPIVAKLYNNTGADYHISAGDKITQLVIMPILTGEKLELADALDDTARGNGGFGSTGK